MADLTQFDVSSAERIANVVRIVEGQPQPARPLEFRKVFQDNKQQRAFRICTFTGEWAIGEDKVVTFTYQESTPNTALATNLFFPIETQGLKNGAVAKDGANWFLIDVPFSMATAVFIESLEEKEVITDISATGQLTPSCGVSITLSKTVGRITVISSTYTAQFLRFQ